MITWDVPPASVPCPHCGAVDTSISLQLFGLIRYACGSCRRTFAVKPDAKTNPTVSNGNTTS